MKKILTITCHKVYNHGATIQQIALLDYLKSLGYDAKTINYTPDYLQIHYNLWLVSPKYSNNFLLKTAYLFLKMPLRIIGLQRKKKFDLFEKKHLSMLKCKYFSNEHLKNNLPYADAYICGSDQIWNAIFENGKDPAFYLNFVPISKLKISYAPSFATDFIEKSQEQFVLENVSRIDHVSVREKSGLKILESIGVQNAVQVLDPVFLLPADYWENKFVKPIDGNYIFVYDFDENLQIKAMAQELSKKHDLKIFTINERIKYADKSYEFDAPDTFLSLVKNAQYVLTNSFHAVAFSLIFNKKFYVFNRSEAINTRMRDLLESVDLLEILWNRNKDNDIDKINFNYQKINNLLDEKIKFSKNFLTNALKDI
ncbi:MAG: polysaccharide pyruvyl transferase family protein [Flavobacterium sp.]|nr:polysaccharide pyruvyl transferase family protein [Flavobacterium sp.]